MRKSLEARAAARAERGRRLSPKHRARLLAPRPVPPGVAQFSLQRYLTTVASPAQATDLLQGLTALAGALGLVTVLQAAARWLPQEDLRLALRALRRLYGHDAPEVAPTRRRAHARALAAWWEYNRVLRELRLERSPWRHRDRLLVALVGELRVPPDALRRLTLGALVAPEAPGGRYHAFRHPQDPDLLLRLEGPLAAAFHRWIAFRLRAYDAAELLPEALVFPGEPPHRPLSLRLFRTVARAALTAGARAHPMLRDRALPAWSLIDRGSGLPPPTGAVVAEAVRCRQRARRAGVADPRPFPRPLD